MSSDNEFSSTRPSRRANMRAIRSRGNRTTELKFRALVASSGIRGWKMHVSFLLGCPDFFFPNERIAIFVDGCFWHGCPKCGHTPKSNRQYWSKKLARNKHRDTQVGRKLRSAGIRVMRFWECQLRHDANCCLKRLFTLLERSPQHP
jgi:DNA mismatch endonuclease (patch repair protein)